MKHPLAHGWPDPLPVLARAEFTVDMLRNLCVVFEAAVGDDPLTIELCDRGVWAVMPDGHRLFIGRSPGPRPLDA
ncbi:hypothetical protein [Paracoccus sp. ME4]|uniref:hypothetical protein n=1 Tax=Paracoccus sp. ME4 TaxID=3138066 RepID=UPI00398B1EA5